jgi:hypothetical protein
MANSSGSFRGFRSVNFPIRWRALLLWSLLASVAAAANPPDYLHAALANFKPEVPRNWAYNLTTEREGQQTTERFDPSKAPAEQWTLLRTAGHSPTAEEREKYFKYKASQTPGAIQATFQRSDIEPGTVKLVHEDTDQADFACSFREQSANSDKMLGHLRLLFTVNKRLSYVEKFSLVLNAPYSPVFSVKMRELLVTMDFSPPEGTRPNLPLRSSSHFAGRIFFISMEENIAYRYSDYAPVP